MKKIGIALGAGGARGLAHIVVLEALEELGLKPSIVAGTSIGAVIGGALAAGLSTREMKDAVDEIRSSKPGRIWNIYERADFKLVLAFVDPTIKTGGLIKGEKFLQFLWRRIRVDRFDDLRVPLRIIATNYRNREEVILQSGNLLKAIRASYAMPGLFTPVQVEGMLLVDGGLKNPLPYDAIQSDCDVTVAIDVSGDRGSGTSKVPHAYDLLFTAYQIMQNSIVSEKLERCQPTIHIKTNIKNVRSLEFNKVKSIYEQAVPAKEELKRKLHMVLA